MQLTNQTAEAVVAEVADRMAKLDLAVDLCDSTIQRAAKLAIASRTAQLTAEEAIATEKAEAHRAGIPGSNEQARTAWLNVHIAGHPTLRRLRAEALEAADTAALAEAAARVADIRQKALREQLAALTALLGLAGKKG